MNDQEIALKLNDHDHEIGSLKHRMKDVEDKQNDIYNLTLSVHDLAKSVEGLAKEQMKQGKRLDSLESEPEEDRKYLRREIIKCLVCGVIGALIAALMALLLK